MANRVNAQGSEPRQRSVDYVILYVSDLGRSVAFYRDMIGLPFKLEGAGYAEFDTEGSRFGLLERSQLPALIGRPAAVKYCQ